jgi:chorismate mutase
MSSHHTNIVNIRKDIDNINSQIIQLLLERKKLSHQIGCEKRLIGMSIYDPTREENIYEKIKRDYPYDFNYLNSIFREIIVQSKLLQN